MLHPQSSTPVKAVGLLHAITCKTPLVNMRQRNGREDLLRSCQQTTRTAYLTGTLRTCRSPERQAQHHERRSEQARRYSAL